MNTNKSKIEAVCLEIARRTSDALCIALNGIRPDLYDKAAEIRAAVGGLSYPGRELFGELFDKIWDEQSVQETSTND